MNSDLVAIARTVRTRGLRGEIVAEVLTGFPERFEGLRRVSGVGPDGKVRELVIEDHWFQKNRIILKFEGSGSVEDAERLVGFDICVPESNAVELSEDEFFDWQLQECKVITTDGTALGEVKEVMRTGGGEVLVVRGVEKEYLIPFVAAICRKVDVEGKVILIDAPEGLLDF